MATQPAPAPVAAATATGAPAPAPVAAATATGAPAPAPVAGAPATGAPSDSGAAPSAAIAPPPSPGQLVPPPPEATAPSNPVQPATLTAPPPQQVRGIPLVLDSATLLLNGALVRLDGIAGERGAPANQLARYIGGREIACEPVDRDAPKYRCTLGRYDLGEAILLNGAGRAAADAPERLRGAEAKARDAGRGVWAR